MTQPKVWYPDLLQCSAKVKKKFQNNFKNYDDEAVRKLCFEIITKAKKIAVTGDIDGLKSLNWFVGYISSVKEEFYDYFGKSNDYPHIRNVLTLICKHNKADFLGYLFSEESKLLWNLLVYLQIVSPTLEDEEHHNAVYYAVRSNNVQLLDILIHKWPGDHFGNNKEVLEEMLSSAYEELKLKNVPLTDETQAFVENLLIDLRFFQESNSKPLLTTQLIQSRIEVLMACIEKLKTSDTVDERFIYLSKCIARNVHVLKRQLKCTYSKLPWEEIEFCLVAFVGWHTTGEGINLIYSSVLNKTKILAYLDHFSCCLKKEFDNIKSSATKKLYCYPNMKREDVTKSISSISPEFVQLYEDYNAIRDVHSLEKIKENIELSLSVDPTDKEGQLVVIRTLQVCGEYFKNTVESPKLSTSTVEMLLSLLPRNTRQIIINLRDSLSHSKSLGKRMEIEKNEDPNFFKNIQNDIKKIKDVIIEILLKSKISVIKLFMQKIADSENLEDIKEYISVLCNLELERSLDFRNSISSSSDISEIEKLVKLLADKVSNKTYYETLLLNIIPRFIDSEKRKFESAEASYMSGTMNCLAFLKQIYHFGKNLERIAKAHTKRTLTVMSTEDGMQSEDLKFFVLTFMELIRCMSSKVSKEDEEMFENLIFKIFAFVELRVGNVKWLIKLRDELQCFEKLKTSSASPEKMTTNKVLQSEHLTSKVSVLEEILNRNNLSSQLVPNFTTYKNDKKMQAAVEMLLLDIMSIFGDLTDNLLFLDENSPLLVGRSLRNHLAHGNVLFDILQNKSSLSIVINAKKIVTEKIDHQKKIGKLISNDPIKLKTKCDQELEIIDVQNSLFDALKHGSLDDVKKSIEKGADLKARNQHLWTSLHFAAQGGNIQIGAFLIKENLDVKAENKDGQTPIHIASTFGRKDMVKLLLKAGVDVLDPDFSSKTPLHFAAQNGHTDVIKLLLRNKASPTSTDEIGRIPIYYAIKSNHKEATEILLSKQSINMSVQSGGWTALHVATEHGHLELVNLFLKHKANVNTKSDLLLTPLHGAALYGHPEVAMALILAGADMNAQVEYSYLLNILKGGTPLHYAEEYNNEEVVELLLISGADVNIADGCNFTPLICAARDGHLGLVKLFLENQSDINHKTIYGTTSLYIAAFNGHLSTVQFLLGNKASVSPKDFTGCSALHVAARNGHADIVKLLVVEGGANINDRGLDQRTPLHEAALTNKPNVVATLIALGADIECKDSDGSTTLHISSQSGHQAVVEHLIANNANLTVQNGKGFPPLFSAIEGNNIDIVKLLIKNGADVDFVNSSGYTALHRSALHGDPEMVLLFLKSRSYINHPCSFGRVPLHYAVQGSHKNAVKVLIETGANVDVKDASGKTPLCLAVHNNSKEIVMDLINAGADLYIGSPLIDAIKRGFTDIALLLINSDKCNSEDTETNSTLLLLASLEGQTNVVRALLMKGADINYTNSHNMSALYCAAVFGHDDVVKVLLKYNSKLYKWKDCDGSTPLHLAVKMGHAKVVSTLLSAGANPCIVSNDNNTSVELAVARDNSEIVELLLSHSYVDANDSNNGHTLLHIAAEKGHLTNTELLVERGADINARNISGSKPIHIAARDGHLNIVKYYLGKNIQINDLGTDGQSLLHYAANGGQLEIAKYLIEQNIDVNISDDTTQSAALHIATQNGFSDMIHILLDNGAYYNATTIRNDSALDIAKWHDHKKAAKLLEMTDKFFHGVKQNKVSETERCLEEGAVVNVKNCDNVTPLHFASWKGYDDIVKILLKYKANPNVTGKSGSTPLHYACRYNHLNIVKSLLLHKAAYNAPCCNLKTPLDFASGPKVKKLLNLINESFQSVRNGDIKIISRLKRIKDKDILKIVMNAHNKDNKSLFTAAVRYDFPKMRQLKQVIHDDVKAELLAANLLCSQEMFEEALAIFKTVFEERKDLLGPEHPDTLEMELQVGLVLYKQHKYKEALTVCEAVYRKQTEALVEENADTIRTKRLIALIYHRQGKNEEALALYEHMLPKLIDILGPNHTDVLSIQCDMAIVLRALFKYEEALKVNYETLNIRKKHYGPNYPSTLTIQNNIALIFVDQGKYIEAMELLKKVYKARKKVLGPVHSETLKTSRSIAILTCLNSKNYDAEDLKEVIEQQKIVLGSDNFDTLSAQYNYANLLLLQGRTEESWKIFEDIIDPHKEILGPNHPTVIDIEKKMKELKQTRNFVDAVRSNFPQENVIRNLPNVFKDMNQFEKEDSVNFQDENNLTPLHYAASEGNERQVKNLLKRGADVMLTSSKGNTALHIAALKGFDNVTDILLQHVKQFHLAKLNDFINAKTTIGGTSALHAARSKKVAVSLLKYGAIYSIKNKNGEPPVKVSKHADIVHLLNIIDETFAGIENNLNSIWKIIVTLEPNDFKAATNARNLNGETIFDKVGQQVLKKTDVK
ncbi:hypothetical protein JTE90_004950 [Oedothorax gibbosus]|uniref:Alpha-latrotoxin n=1 Tax=Oedothorax gibbosus TaxID=931172 RepID=A0AAV6VBS5_9ARAC|nr:hypothetical protein JTE90_004950 [Oedothorax gibbosus]